MNYLIIGAGAIGTYIGGSLLDSGQQVSFLEKESFAARLEKAGLYLKRTDKEITIEHVRVFSNAAQAFQTHPDVVVFAMKSFDTPVAITEIAPFKDEFGAILCLQNGVENEIAIENVLGKDKVIAGSVTSAVGRLDIGRVVLERFRGIGIENRSEWAERIIREFILAGLNARGYKSREDMKWSKMLSNLLGNATCAILDMTPAEVFSDPDLFHLETRQIKEGLAVMHANGWHAVNLPRTPMGLLTFVLEYFPEGINRYLLRQPLGGGRGNKMPSFHIDLHAGRKQSEVVFLNGAVSRFGIKAGIRTPVNDTLNETLEKLVKDPGMIESYCKNKKQLLQDLKTKEG
jgi:2-dehydropantoate 2-reductase